MRISITNNIEIFRDNYKDERVNVLITGDFCPNYRISELIEKEKYHDIFNDFLPFSQKADISLTNLECPLLSKGIPIPKRGPVLNGPEKAVDALRFGGFNAVSLANNHIRDFGDYGVKNTIEVLEKENIEYVGAGRTIEDAMAPLYFNVKERRIGIVNITEYEFSIASKKSGGAAPLDIVENYYQILDAQKKSDFVILIIHGGHEFYPLPSPEMTKLYRYFADLGVDAIIGHHAHVFTGYEMHKKVPIFYNIGNYLFDRKRNSDTNWNEGFAVMLSFDRKALVDAYLIPYTQNRDLPGVHLLSTAQIEGFTRKISKYNTIIKDKEVLKNEFAKFLAKQKNYYLTTFLGLNKYKRKLMKWNIFPKLFLNKNKLINNINHLRCQSHREAVIEILKNETGIE